MKKESKRNVIQMEDDMKKFRFIVDGVRQFLFWKKNIRQTKEGHFVCSNANELEEWEEWDDCSLRIIR